MSAGPAGAGYARIAVPVPVRKTSTYRVPEALREGIAVGTRVRVPFGPRRIEGTVVEWPVAAPGEDVEVRDVDRLLPDAPAPTPPVLAAARFVADYYLCSLGEAADGIALRECLRRLAEYGDGGGGEDELFHAYLLAGVRIARASRAAKTTPPL